MKSTKKSLIASALSLVLCISMLLGTTYAWFTDSVTSGKNKIIAGNLDVELTHTNAKVTNQKVQDATDLFGVSLWEPGVIAYENLTVTNVGNLALKYALNLNVFDKNATTAGNDLTEVIKVAVIDGGFTATGNPVADRASAQAITTYESLKDFQKTGNLAGADSTGDTFGVVLYWQPTDNDNLYNLKNGLTSTDGQPLFVEFGVNLVATQDTVENDSFDDQYDVSAELPVIASFPNIKKADVTDASKSLKINKQGALESAEVKATGAKTVFESLEDKTEGRTNDMTLTLSVNEIGSKEKEVEGGKEKTLNFDINMSAVMKVTNASTGALIDTKKNDNVEKLDEFTTIKLKIGKYSSVSVLHKSVAMEKLASATAIPTDTVNGGYFYDGEEFVYVVTKTFSPFSFVLSTDHDWKYTSNNNGTHNAVCKNDASHKLTNEACDTAGTDGACSKCGYKKQLQKGSIMHLDVNGDGNAEDFIVLKKNGDQVEIMARDAWVPVKGGIEWAQTNSSTSTKFNMSCVGKALDKTTKQTVYNADGDSFNVSTYYMSLSSATKSAIVSQTRKQESYIRAVEKAEADYTLTDADGKEYYIKSYGEGSNDSTASKNVFNVYTLEFEDLIEYFGTGNLTAKQLKELFNDTTYSFWMNTQCYNRKNGVDYPGQLGYMYYSNGVLWTQSPFGVVNNNILPVMTLDLTKLTSGFYTFE